MKIFFKIIGLFIVIFNINNVIAQSLSLQVNRNVFISGENLFFKAYLKDADAHLSNKNCILFVELINYSHKKIFDTRFNVKQGTCDGIITLNDSLESGYYTLHAFTTYLRQATGEEYLQQILIINSQEENLDSVKAEVLPVKINTDSKEKQATADSKSKVYSVAYTDKQIYSTREKVQLNLRLTDFNDNPVNANLAISVTEQTPTGKMDSALSYTNISSTVDRDEDYILSGCVINTKTNQCAPDVCVLLVTPDSIANMKYCFTDNLGRFYFPLNKFYDNKQLILRLKNLLPDFKIETDEKCWKKKETVNTNKIALSHQWKEYLRKSKKITLVNKIYNNDLVMPVDDSNLQETQRFSFFGNPEEVIKPEDYEDMKDFSDLAQNILTKVKFKKTKNNYAVYLFDSEWNIRWPEEALVLINNIPVTDLSYLSTLSSEKIQRIEITHRRIVYGNIDFYGVLSVFTKKSIDLDTKITDNALIVDNTKEIQHVQPVSPDYTDNSNSKEPDFRQMLYWNSQVITNTQQNKPITFNFFTSDLKTKYKVDIKGYSTDGLPINKTLFFEVK